MNCEAKIVDLKQEGMLQLIEENSGNHHLKCDYATKIHLFRYKRLLRDSGREFSVAVNNEWIIQWIATYRFRTLTELWSGRNDPDCYFISLSVIERTKGLWTRIVEHTLRRIKERVNVVTLTIEPLEVIYHDRLRKFLQRKCQENGLEMRESLF